MQKSRFKAWTVILFYGKMLTLSADSFNPKQIFYETKTIFIFCSRSSLAWHECRRTRIFPWQPTQTRMTA